jgi:type IV secretory pathway VirB4 component
MGKKVTSVDQTIPYRQFLPPNPNEIDLRGLGFTLGFAMRGPEPESSTPATRLALSQQITSAFARLNTGDMVDVIFHRMRAPQPPARSYPSAAARLVDQEHRSVEHWINKARFYLSHHYPHPLWSWLHTWLFSAHRRAATREQMRQEAHQRFASVLDAIGGELHITALDSSAMLRDLNLIINGIDMPILLPDESVRLNHVLANQDQTNGREPMIGQLYQCPVTIDVYPTTTYPQMLAALLNEPGEMMLCCRYIAREPYDVQSDLRKIGKDWENMDLGRMSDIIFQAIGYDAGARRNQSARQMIDELDHEVIPEASQGMPFGWMRIVAVPRDVDRQRCVARAHDHVRENLKTILLYYSDGGFYGHVFDHQGGDTLRIGTNPIGVYELRSLTLLGKLAAAPAIELILHQIINTMDGTPTWLFFDELWWFLQDETSADFLFDTIGSVRKRGGCFVGATPSTVEIANSPFVARLLVNCPGQVFFANHMLRTGDAYVTEQYRQLGVPEHLIATIGGARRKRDLVYKEPEHARLAPFRLGRVGQKICGATGFNDIKRFRQLIAAHGNDRDAVLAAWLAD